MITLKSSKVIEDDYIFKICPNTDNSCAYIKLKANSLAKFAQRIKLYDSVPKHKLGDEAYYLARMDMDNRENRINISLPDSRGRVRLTLTRIYFDKLTKAGCKIEAEEAKNIFHNKTRNNPAKASGILQLSSPNIPAQALQGVVFKTSKDSPFLSRLTAMEIYLPVTDLNFAVVVQTLSEKCINYNMDYSGLTIDSFEAILGVIALGGKFTGSDDILAMASGLAHVA